MLNSWDQYYMQLCLSLATKGWGMTLTNPLVGALIVKQNRIIGQGYHRKLGEAHAEIIALLAAGTRARGATLYVNLEPCCCMGRTPPCVIAIIMAGIKRVVIGAIDPNPNVNGKGITQLRAHGIDVQVGILAQPANDLNRAYRTWIRHGKPYTILKIAVSANGKLSGYPRRYITSLPSLRYVHALRSQVNAVLIGVHTVQYDNPMLTDRLVGRHSPTRIILDPDLEIPLDAHVLKSDVQRIIVTHSVNIKKIRMLEEMGTKLHFYKGDLCPVTSMLQALGSMNIGSMMVEGGAIVFNEFFDENAYDEIFLFMAPHDIPQGLSLTDRMLHSIISQDNKPEIVGEDRLYHVYRDH